MEFLVGNPCAKGRRGLQWTQRRPKLYGDKRFLLSRGTLVYSLYPGYQSFDSSAANGVVLGVSNTVCLLL